MGETDEELMAAFQSGSEEAFKTLFDRYAVRLFNFSLRFFKSNEEAEDVAQEVLLRVFHKKERFDASKPFRPWIFTIASRMISNRLRDKKRHPHLSLDKTIENYEGEDLKLDLVESPQLRPDTIHEGIEITEAVRRAIEALPENQRVAVLLARYEEMSYEDIAQSMSTSVSSVKSLLFRARITLAKVLAPFAPNQAMPEKTCEHQTETI
jgi:RNA polymerase sigma-70 factor (ECF subfamily)